jgi:hypothetical protein
VLLLWWRALGNKFFPFGFIYKGEFIAGVQNAHPNVLMNIVGLARFCIERQFRLILRPGLLVLEP